MEKEVKKVAKTAAIRRLRKNWQHKSLHGQFAKRVEQADVDKDKSFIRLKSNSLKPKTEGFILAAQDQSLKTRNYEKPCNEEFRRRKLQILP